MSSTRLHNARVAAGTLLGVAALAVILLALFNAATWGVAVGLVVAVLAMAVWPK